MIRSECGETSTKHSSCLLELKDKQRRAISINGTVTWKKYLTLFSSRTSTVVTIGKKKITIPSQSQASLLLGGLSRRKPPGPSDNQANEFPTRDTEFLVFGARASIEEIYPPRRAKSTTVTGPNPGIMT